MKHPLSVFDILGPVMVGPSSSHTAGAVRIGQIARLLLADEPAKVEIGFHGSFAATYWGHGTDKAVLGGLLGFPVDDPRLKTAADHAREQGLSWTISSLDLGPSYHPNSVQLDVTGKHGEHLNLIASSTGGGTIEIKVINGIPVSVTGTLPTVLIVAQDQPGSLQHITGIFAGYGVNIATLHLDRLGKGGEAVMVVETDQKLPRPAIEELKALSWVRVVRTLDKVMS